MKPITILQVWPGFMSVETAAAYCDMRRTEFQKAVAVGDMPQPVLINGQERWRLADLENAFESVPVESEIWATSPYPKRRG